MAEVRRPCSGGPGSTPSTVYWPSQEVCAQPTRVLAATRRGVTGPAPRARLRPRTPPPRSRRGTESPRASLSPVESRWTKKRPWGMRGSRHGLGRTIDAAPARARADPRPRRDRAAGAGGARASRVPRWHPRLRHRRTRVVTSRLPPARHRASAVASVGARWRAGCGADALRGHGRAPRPCRGSSSPSPLPE